MTFDETIHTTARIRAIQDPARLERARHARDASSAGSRRPHAVAQVGMLLSQGRAWLRRVPATVPTVVPAIVPAVMAEIAPAVVGEPGTPSEALT